MAGDDFFADGKCEWDGSSDWLSSARLIPAPHTASEKAAIATSLVGRPAYKPQIRARLAFGTAAVVAAVSVPSLSLEAMVGNISGPYFSSGPLFGAPDIENPYLEGKPVSPMPSPLPTEVWSPAADLAGPIYAQTLAAREAGAQFSSKKNLGKFTPDLPLAVLDHGSREFDLAFASVEMPSTLTALMVPGHPSDPSPLAQTRKSAIATRTIAIEQITDLDLIVRATPENAGAEGQTLASGTASARTEAIASRSVETAFAGAIDASIAVRSSLPIAPNQPLPRADAVRRAFPLGIPPPEVSATAAAEAVLVPKTKLDARVNGVLTGSVEFEQREGTIAIRLRSIANMMREQFSKTEFAHLVSGQSIDTFVPLAQLQAAGIPVNYNPAYDEIEFGIDFQDAPNATKVQVDQISVVPVGSDLTAIEQIPR